MLLDKGIRNSGFIIDPEILTGLKNSGGMSETDKWLATHYDKRDSDQSDDSVIDLNGPRNNEVGANQHLPVDENSQQNLSNAQEAQTSAQTTVDPQRFCVQDNLGGTCEKVWICDPKSESRGSTS